MKLLLMSDLHGHLPVVQTPVDIVCIAGDIEPLQYSSNPPTRNGLKKSAEWLFQKFYPWMENLTTSGLTKYVVYTWGNHDWVPYYQLHKEGPRPPANCYELCDSGVDALGGLNFWGTPWSPTFYDWAYNADEPELAEKWAVIPESTDVLIVHGPPHGVCDRVGKTHVGSPSLRARAELIEPSIVVCGHVHVGYGEGTIRGNSGHNIHVYNSSVCDERYRPVNPMRVVEV
jgi:Icc-related predicted phosphoesterase